MGEPIHPQRQSMPELIDAPTTRLAEVEDAAPPTAVSDEAPLAEMQDTAAKKAQDSNFLPSPRATPRSHGTFT